MTTLKFCFSCFPLFTCLTLFSQETPPPINKSFNLVPATEISLPPESRNQGLNIHPSNQVFIEQIGNGNISSTHLSTEESTVASHQKGNFNSVHIAVTAESMRETVLQDGNRNHAFDFAFDPSEEISLHLAQKGSGQHFARHGSNSIGNQLQIKMSGNSTAVIVRNFK